MPEEPVHERHVGLPDLPARGVAGGESREIAELNRLTGDAEGARDERLGSDDRGTGRQGNERVEEGLGGEEVEGVSGRLWPGKEERPLPEVVEHEPGEDDEKPADSDRCSTEVPHVGIERLSAGEDEKD